MSKADFLFWWGNIVQLWSNCSIHADTDTVFFSVFVPPSSDQLNADTGNPSFTLIGRTTNQVLTTIALKKKKKKNLHCPFNFLFSSVSSHFKWIHQGSQELFFFPFFSVFTASGLFYLWLRCFFQLLRPLEVKPKDGAKADRCGRIDLQVPAPPQEDTTLHRGAIDGQG